MTERRPIASRGMMGSMAPGPGFHARVLRGEAGSIDPFLSIDHFRMTHPTFPPHPHAGFSAVTVMLADSKGGFVNRDSLGDRSRIAPGDLHWAQAGRGMVHDEVPEEVGVECHGLQIFVNLPARAELEPAASFKLDAADVPVVRPAEGATVRVLCGEFHGARSPLLGPVVRPLMLDIHLGPGASLEVPIPEGHGAFVLGLAGEADLGGGAAPLRTDEAVGFERSAGVVALTGGDSGAHVFLGSGEPLDEPVAFAGPFALSSEERALDAHRRYAAGEMGHLEPLA